MIVGHYAPAYALRARYDDVPLWVLCLAVQAPDAALYLLLPLGIESMPTPTPWWPCSPSAASAPSPDGWPTAPAPG